MSYLVYHHGTFWFQIRVPKSLVPRYGTHIRQNLGLTERALVQPLAYQLASQWLSRFAFEKTGVDSLDAVPFSLFQNATHAGEYDLPAMLRPSAPPQQPMSPQRSSDLLNDVADSFDGLLRYWRMLHTECSPSTYKEVTSVVKHAKRSIQKRPSELQRTDIAAYRDRLIASRLARATVSKKIGFISTLLQTAVDSGVLKHNVARGLRIPKPKVDTVVRRAFTPKELEKIFLSPVYSQQKRYRAGGGAAARWLPLIALATGTRLEEICQLKVSDILLDYNHGPLLRICDDGEGQRVKTSGSRRIIPLHPDLLKAGFLDYRQEIEELGHDWLFPALEPDHDGRRSGNWSKWFGRYLRSSRGCHILDRRLVFHSFRHTFKTLCREAILSEETHDALTGHKSSTVGRSYGHVPLSTLVEAVGRIRFPVTFPKISD